MKKLMYVFAILAATLWLNVSCSSDKNDEPEEPQVTDTIPTPPAPTTSDSLQGTWYGFSGQIQGTSPVGTVHELTLAICDYDTLTFSGTSVTQKWWLPTYTNTSFPHKILRGTFSISNNILTNAMTSMDIWDTFDNTPSYNQVISENHTYKLSFATNPTKAPYTKDTLTLVMTGATEINTNGFGSTMTIYSDAEAADNPKLTLKFARKP